ncbi:MAG TPA: sulfotransferase [Terriglobales bacterium]|jgi:hypothetical protein|nr:sulfotransferase [Terriglobales bacterium]
MSNSYCNQITRITNEQSPPSFFVIGPPRTGTSWIHDVLSQYTSLPNHIKETRFFDLHFDLGMDWYLRYFSKPNDSSKPRGEVAPTYFASTQARERIARTCPGAKVICIFRHPVERALSLYRIKRAYGMVRCSFEDAVLFDPELLESGKYATYLKSWYHAMGSAQVLATFYDQLRDRSQAYVDEIADFIGIRRFELSAAQRRLVHPSEGFTQPRNFMFTRIGVALANRLKAGHLDRIALAIRKSALGRTFLSGGDPFTPLSPIISRAVLDMFLPEVESLETMLNVDLSAWKSKEKEHKMSLIDYMTLHSCG